MVSMATIFYSIIQKYDFCTYKEQLHPKIHNFKDNRCLFEVDNVLPILNCLSMFIIVSELQALSGQFQTCFRWGVVRLNYTSYNSIIIISIITLIDERFTCFHTKFYRNMFIYYREDTRKPPKASELRHSTSIMLI